MKERRVLVSLTAWKGSGKDTLADYLVSEYGFQRISFAAKLKDMVAMQYDVPREFMDSPTHKEMPLLNLPVIPSDPTSERLQEMLSTELRSGYWTPRALCILEGSTKRSVYSNYWVRQAINTIGDNPEQSYVITDMRYKTEADIINMFYPENQIVRIERFETSPTLDPSERDMDDYCYDYKIPNKGTIEELHMHANLLVTRLLNPY
jgi:hypothetical protein